MAMLATLVPRLISAVDNRDNIDIGPMPLAVPIRVYGTGILRAPSRGPSAIQCYFTIFSLWPNVHEICPGKSRLIGVQNKNDICEMALDQTMKSFQLKCRGDAVLELRCNFAILSTTVGIARPRKLKRGCPREKYLECEPTTCSVIQHATTQWPGQSGTVPT